MLRRSFSFGMILVLALVAISSMGVAYGAWSSTLLANGTIQTGAFHPIFSRVSAAHTPDFGDCTATIQTPVGAIPLMEFGVTGAFPGFQCTISFDIKNSGSIPVVFQKVTYSPDAADKTSKFVWGTGKPACGETLAPGAVKTYDFSYQIPLAANPPQNATFKNALEFTLVQINMYDAATCTVLP